MRRVTADTNILISGLIYRRGKPFELLRMALGGEINLTISQAIIDETMDVLVPKFNVPLDDLAAYEGVLRQAARTVTPAERLEVIKEDPADHRILECAVTAGSEYIVSGDKDLLRLGSYDSIKILNVSDFLAIAKAQGPPR